MDRYFVENAEEDYAYLLKYHKKLAIKVDELLNSIEKTPYEGIGKPEPLKNQFSGYWSRRINKEHRLIYKVENDAIIIIACRYHYGK